MNAKQQTGFTLIELVIVIVILGILAAVAVPKYIDLKADAELAALNGVAGAVSSAFVVNYGAYAVNSTKGVAVSGAAVNVSAVVGSIMAGGALPSGYTATAAASTVACGTGQSGGATVAISISNSGNTTNKATSATLICTG